jgi:acyl-CoA thioesterase FadM
LAEGRDGDLLLITGAILRVGRSSVGLGLKLSNPHTHRLLSICKSTLVLVNSSNGKSTQWPNKYREFLKSAVITLSNEDIKYFES